MTEAEIRAKLLTQFYELRHNNDGWVPVSDMVMSPTPVRFQVLAGVCQHLADVDLIRWKPLKGPEGFVAGMAKITGKGAAAFESKKSADIDLQFPTPPTPAIPDEPLAAPEQAESGAKLDKPAQWSDVFTLKPGFMGMSIDLKELWKLFRVWGKR